ncbi:hypothetical protein H0H81_008223 [Sphagnurus paluster]|uniref:ENTH domain-containing protein n=1 Tax=Sphagnurus paluster TaxID=117069 RepID=A0A9P7K4R6_9AGAR|nr:hypothetical protein H0H81_008223 [Sphagnurus paluster]
MPCIYARFMEKEARQWRQIYKALQLLEYLIKHGSERVVDDARSHVSTIKMLRNFHYIDDKGKDEGINVRNRSREIVELLSDVEKIRAERRKAKANKNKYIGTGNDGGMSFSTGSTRYGGFGNDSYGGNGGGGNYGNDYGSYGAGSSGGGGSSFRDDSRRGGAFEEYNAGDDEDVSTRSSTSRARPSTRQPPTRKASAPAPTPPPAPAPVEDLLGGFGDDEAFSAPVASNGALVTNKALPAVAPPVAIDDDDFDDFQAAPIQAALTAPTPVASVAAKPNLMDLINSTPSQPQRPQSQQQPAFGGMNMGMGMGTGMGMGVMGGMHRASPSLSSQTSQPTFSGVSPLAPRPAPATGVQTKPSGGGAFDDLWSMSLGAKPATPTTTGGAGKSIKDLEREKAMAGLWGGTARKPAAPVAPTNAFGSFGGSSMAPASGGDDDLLL